MILSPRTVQILHNFQTINQSIVVQPGNVISTIADNDNVIARAQVADTFDSSFAIYDLGRLLALLAMDKQSELNFKEKFLEITQQGRSRVRYTYCNPTLIKAAPAKSPNLPDPIAQFVLRAETLQNVYRAMQILGFNEIEIAGNGSTLTVSAISKRTNSSSDLYTAEIGQTKQTFSAVIEVAGLKLINQDYDVSLFARRNPKGEVEALSHFINREKDGWLEYWVALSNKSEFAI